MANQESDFARRIRKAQENPIVSIPNPYGFRQGFAEQGKVIRDSNTGVTTRWIPHAGETRVDAFSPNLYRRITLMAYIAWPDSTALPPYNGLTVHKDIEDKNQWVNFALENHGASMSDFFRQYGRPSSCEVNTGVITADGTIFVMDVKYVASAVWDFKFTQDSGDIVVDNKPFKDSKEANGYILQRGINANITDALHLVRLKGAQALDPRSKLDGTVEYNGTKEMETEDRLENIIEQAYEQAPEGVDIDPWDLGGTEDILTYVREQTKRYLFPMALTSDVNFAFSEIENACEIIALETAPEFAKCLYYLHEETIGNDKLTELRNDIDEVVAMMLSKHYAKLQRAGKVEVKYRFLHDKENTFEVEFRDSEQDAVVNQDTVQIGQKYHYDGNDYLLTYEGDKLIFAARSSLSPTKGVRIAFPGKNVDVRAAMLAAQTTENAGWEKALDHFSMEITASV